MSQKMINDSDETIEAGRGDCVTVEFEDGSTLKATLICREGVASDPNKETWVTPERSDDSIEWRIAPDGTVDVHDTSGGSADTLVDQIEFVTAIESAGSLPSGSEHCDRTGGDE